MSENRLNKSVLKQVLTKKENHDVEIFDFKVSMGSRKGDNYMSDIYRINVDYKLNGEAKNCSLIAKCLFLEGDSIPVMEEYDSLGKEKQILSEILPKMNEFIGEKLGPDCYHATDEEVVFFMEDLKSLGFDVAERVKGLDLIHSKLFIEKLAKFHAASMILAEKQPQVFENFPEGLLKKSYKATFMADFIESSFKLFMEVSRNWKGCETIVRKIEKVVDNIQKKLIEVVYQPSKFNVLNHGDCWINNAMFQYEDDSRNPIDVLFVSILIF